MLPWIELSSFAKLIYLLVTFFFQLEIIILNISDILTRKFILIKFWIFYSPNSFFFSIRLSSHDIFLNVAFLTQTRCSSGVQGALRQLVSSAGRLQNECRGHLSSHSHTLDPKFVTQQVIQCAYDIAKAAKLLVTHFQWILLAHNQWFNAEEDFPQWESTRFMLVWRCSRWHGSRSFTCSCTLT